MRLVQPAAVCASVAQRFATDHHELVVGPHHAELLPRLVWHYNEPYADSSALPTFILCGLARKSVTVALNGDGGDESFMGYPRYLGLHLTAPLDRLPVVVRRAAALAAKAMPLGRSTSRLGRLRRLAAVLPLDRWERYARWITHFDNDQKRALYTPEFARQVEIVDSVRASVGARLSSALNAGEAAADADMQAVLPEDLLVKMDPRAWRNRSKCARRARSGCREFAPGCRGR